MQTNEIREAVGVFHDPDKLDAAIAELEVTAFPRPDISVLGNDLDLQRKIGPDAFRMEWLEDHPDTPREISIRPEEKVIGTGFIIGCCAYVTGCAAALAAKTASNIGLLTSITAGSIIGAIFGIIIVFFIGSRINSKITRQLRQGGLLVWVRTTDSEQEKIAQEILRKHGATHVHIHSFA